jgi:SAM-dependent methyltransferase
MDHADHVGLLREGIAEQGGTWADLGAGSGAFTLALADLLGPGAVVYAVDRDRRALAELESTMRTRFPETLLHSRVADFTRPLDLPSLDGVVMANSLHFVRYSQQEAAIRRVRGYLREGGRLVLVEYGTDRGNAWVPYPLSYSSWEDLAGRAGFADIRLLRTRPSRTLGEIYSALST